MSLFIIFLTISLLAGSIQAGVIAKHYGGQVDLKGEVHDFSDGLDKGKSSNHESLGSLGDHLHESHFPSDFAENYKGVEYEEAASEHVEYGGYDHKHYPNFKHESTGSSHNIHSKLHDFDSEAVPGINHGKGALSYSTSYGFENPKQ